MKKIYIVILAAVMIISFAACETVQKQDNSGGAAGINQYHPIFVGLKKREGTFTQGTVIGGSSNGKWFGNREFEMKVRDKTVSAEDCLNDQSLNGNVVDMGLVKGDEQYKVYSVNKFIGVVKGEKPAFFVDGYANELLTVDIEPVAAEEGLIVGISGEWEALPRIPRETSEKGTYSIDIDNDGKDDVLRIKETEIRQQGYEGEEYTERGINIEVEKDGQKISVEEIVLDGTYASDCKILTVDLNGDGKLEVLTAAIGHNTSVRIYEIDGNKANTVLSFYQGD